MPKSVLSTVAARYRAIRFAPIYQRPITLNGVVAQVNQADESNQRRGEPIGDKTWIGWQKVQLETQVNPYWATAGGITYYQRTAQTPRINLNSYPGQYVAPGYAVLNSGAASGPYPSVGTPEDIYGGYQPQPSLVAGIRAAITRRFANGS